MPRVRLLLRWGTVACWSHYWACDDRSVIRHVVLWAFTESVPPAERDGIVAAGRGLRATVPSLRSLEVGENVSLARAHGYSHVLVATFDDRDGLAAYMSHPDHVPVGARLQAAAAAQLLVVDLEV